VHPEAEHEELCPRAVLRKGGCPEETATAAIS